MVIKLDKWLKNLIEGKAIGKLRRGRPRTRFMDSIIKAQSYVKVKDAVLARKLLAAGNVAVEEK